jgi:hypothetical protein
MQRRIFKSTALLVVLTLCVSFSLIIVKVHGSFGDGEPDPIDGSVPGDILPGGYTIESIVGGDVFLFGASVRLRNGALSPLRTRAMIVALPPKHQRWLGGTIPDSSDMGPIRSGVITWDVYQFSPSNQANKGKITIKRVGLRYHFDGHEKIVTIENRRFNWNKTSMFLVVYDNNRKPSTYVLSNDFTSPHMPKETLRALRKRFPRGVINKPLPL